MEARIIVILSVLLIVAIAGCTSESGNKNGGGTSMKLTSTAFDDGGTIPVQYTSNGANISPPLSWSSAPGGTKAFAILCEDLDSPSGTFTHWIIFNIPADVTQLTEGIPTQNTLSNGAKQGNNDFGTIGYSGPAPPSGVHRYTFILYALDSQLNLNPGVTRGDFLKAAEAHTLAQTRLTGRYGK
jgi:Raf kinase inhibitor-like YbhB/YbcL family protein